MTVKVAGRHKEVKDGITVAELMAQENIETPNYVTVSINDKLAKIENFVTQRLKNGDNVKFLYFMGGGF